MNRQSANIRQFYQNLFTTRLINMKNVTKKGITLGQLCILILPIR